MKTVKVMPKRWNLLLVIAAFMLLSGCEPVPFCVSGKGTIDGTYYEEITGTMDIKEPVVTEGIGGNISFNYEITDFSFDIGITGSGSINSIYYGYADFTCEFDTFHLVSDDSTIHWDLLSASGVVFYDEKGVPYQDVGAPTDFYNLPYKIEAADIGDTGVYFKHLVIERMAPGCDCHPQK